MVAIAEFCESQRQETGDDRRSNQSKGAAMASEKRVFSDCRAFESDKPCSLYIAGTEEEVLGVAIGHAIKIHGHEDTPGLRDELRKMLQDEPAGR